MSDSITINIKAVTMEGLGAIDPEVRIEIVEVTPSQKTIAQNILKDFHAGATILVPMPDGFPTWQVNVRFSRFDAVSGFFFQPKGNQSPSYTIQVTRLPDKWTPSFTELAMLPAPRCAPLKNVLAVSKNVDLKNGPPIGELTANYDSIAAEPQVLAKTALLNLYAVLWDEQDPIDRVPWFSHVRKIVRLDQERFLAEVDPALFENVQTILDSLHAIYAKQGYSTEPPADMGLHKPNIPPQYDAANNAVQGITLKKAYEQGNVQLTLWFLRVNGNAVHLLDCDMDEHLNILTHSVDIIKHLATGGTNPILMHEYIVEYSAQKSTTGIADIDLGYQLV